MLVKMFFLAVIIVILSDPGWPLLLGSVKAVFPLTFWTSTLPNNVMWEAILFLHVNPRGHIVSALRTFQDLIEDTNKDKQIHKYGVLLSTMSMGGIVAKCSTDIAYLHPREGPGFWSPSTTFCQPSLNILAFFEGILALFLFLFPGFIQNYRIKQ